MTPYFSSLFRLVQDTTDTKGNEGTRLSPAMSDLLKFPQVRDQLVTDTKVNRKVPYKDEGTHLVTRK